MKIQSYTYPKSSFLSMEKDLSILVNLFLRNERLKKMLYYTSKDCLLKPNLTEDQSLGLFGNNIKIVPKMKINGATTNYIFITFNSFTKNPTNPEFRDNILEIDILCPFDQWQLKDFELRPYRIAAEIDTMLNHQRLTGIGELSFVGAEKIMENDEFGGVCLLYRAVHGGEDNQKAPNPVNEQDLVANFDAIFNS